MNRTMSILLAALACAACSAPETRTVGPESTPSATVPAALPAATPTAEGVTAADVMAVAPELTASSAALLVERFGARYATAEAIAEAGIATASTGFGTLDPAAAKEAGALLDAAYATLGSGGRARIGSYFDHVRSGRVTPEESREGRRLFTEALHRLPEARRSRLASLYESAIAAGLKEVVAAEARTRDAQPVGIVPAAANGPVVGMATSPAVTRGGSVDNAMSRVVAPKSSLSTRGEAYWKAEAQGRHERLATLEKDLVAAEAEGARYVYPPKITGQTGFDAPTPDPFYNRREQINKRIAQLKVKIESARKAVLDLEFDCVHDNGLPGWAR
jgi:hypothetical protein